VHIDLCDADHYAIAGEASLLAHCRHKHKKHVFITTHSTLQHTLILHLRAYRLRGCARRNDFFYFIFDSRGDVNSLNKLPDRQKRVHNSQF